MAEDKSYAIGDTTGNTTGDTARVSTLADSSRFSTISKGSAADGLALGNSAVGNSALGAASVVDTHAATRTAAGQRNHDRADKISRLQSTKATTVRPEDARLALPTPEQAGNAVRNRFDNVVAGALKPRESRNHVTITEASRLDVLAAFESLGLPVYSDREVGSGLVGELEPVGLSNTNELALPTGIDRESPDRGL